MSKAARATALMAALLICVGCGNTFRPVTTTLPVSGGNPAGAETAVVLNQCPCPPGSVGRAGGMCMDTNTGIVSPNVSCMNGKTGIVSASILTEINVAGDFNGGNRQLLNGVGDVTAGTVGGVSIPASPMAFDASRTTVMTANTDTDSVSIQLIGTITGGFASGTTTLTLPAGSKPIGLSFQFFGTNYTQDYVVNSGPNSVCPAVGSLGVISQPGGQLTATVCVGISPIAAWIYKDQSKVFVLDNTENQVYVVNASTYKVTNFIGVGSGPVKAAQDRTGQYIYVLNSGDGSVSVLDGQAELVAQTVAVSGFAVCGTNTPTPFLCDSPVIDMQQEAGVDDTNPNRNRLWLLHANGSVSVWDGTTPGQLTWVTSVATITAAQAAAVPAAYPTNLALLRDLSFAYVGIGNTDQMVAIDLSLLHNGEITPGADSAAIFPATSSVTVGIHRSIVETLTDTVTEVDEDSGAVTVVQVYSDTVPVEETTPVVKSVAVSRGFTAGNTGSSSVLFKAYATTVTTTKYYCYDVTVTATDCGSMGAPVPNPWTHAASITTVTTDDGGGNPILPPPPPAGSEDFLAAGCVNNGDNTMTCDDLYNGTSVVTAATQPGVPINSLITTIAAPMQVLYCNPGSPDTGQYDGQKNCPAMQPLSVLGRN